MNNVMFEDLKNWCEEGVLYYRCIKDDSYFICDVEYEVDEVKIINDGIWLLVGTGKMAEEMYISIESDCFEIVVK